MRRLIIYIHILTTILFSSCNSCPIPSEMPDTMGHVLSRGIITDTVLKANDQALFNATGGLSLTNRILTFNGKNWEDEETLFAPDSSQETSLTAFHPAYNSEGSLITSSPYSDNELEDVLMAQCTFTNQTDIELKFKHLFSLLTFRVQSPLKESLDMVSLTMPKIEAINPTDGSLKISGEHTTRLYKNENGDYSFIVPPLENCDLTISFTSSDGEKSHTLKHSFTNGHKYECNVISHDNRPGIRNAEDLIAFSLFINDPNNKGKMHADFGEKIGDSIVYRLLADIALSEEDCNKFTPIGNHSYTPFHDTFDGEGHTISNFILPDENTELYYTGLFGHIDSNGTVKNLNVTHATSINSPTCRYVGVIAAYNGGSINNCSVQNSRINSSSEYYIGLICGTMTGKIINCYTQNNTIDVSKGTRAGSIAGSSSGSIINCYTYNNSFNMSSSSYAGCILGASTNKAKIENCYIYHNKTTYRWGAAIGYAYTATIKNFFYNKGTLAYNTNYTESNTEKYDDNNFYINDTHIIKLLNQWIATTGKESYPEYTFRQWTTAADGSPCFE